MSSECVPRDIEYREVPGFPEYRVGSDVSLWTNRPKNRWEKPSVTWRKVEPFAQSRTRKPSVRLVHPGGDKKEFAIASLVASVFGGADDVEELNIPETQLAWAAGFFDGEGHVSIFCQKKAQNTSAWFVLHIGVTNTHRESLERLKSMFGFGTIHAVPPQEGRRPVFRWLTSAAASERFAKAILPYSIVKSRQLRLAIEFRGLGQKRPFKKISEEMYEKGCEVAKALREANGRSYLKENAKVPSRDCVEAC